MYLFISYYNYLSLSVYILEFLLFLIHAFIHAFALTVPLVWNYLPSDIFMEHSFSFLKTLIKLLLGVFFPRIYWKHIMLSEHSLFFSQQHLPPSIMLYFYFFILFVVRISSHSLQSVSSVRTRRFPISFHYWISDIYLIICHGIGNW